MEMQIYLEVIPDRLFPDRSLLVAARQQMPLTRSDFMILVDLFIP